MREANDWKLDLPDGLSTEEIQLAYLAHWQSLQTFQSTLEQVKECIEYFWNLKEVPVPKEIVLCDSPIAAKAYITDDKAESLMGAWRGARAAYFDSEAHVGNIDWNYKERKSLWMHRCWAIHVPFLKWTDDVVAVSQSPLMIAYNDDMQTHCDDGPCVEFKDGEKRYCVDGVAVREHVIMNPESITLEEINRAQDIFGQELNEDVRAILIERYGWMRFLQDTNATVIDTRRNDIENTVEILAQTNFGKRLITNCPSTGTKHSLSFPDDATVNTCEEAQSRLWGDSGIVIVGRT